MSPEIVHALRRPLLLSCIALALSGVASAAPIRPYTESVHVGGRRDDAAALEPYTDPASTRLHPVHVESVFNCGDSGPGSLRDAVAAAIDGDTLDLTQLNCSTISLTTGSIHIPQDTLSLVGPGTSLSLTRGVGYMGRILTHSGSGTLSISGLTVSFGYDHYDGGCILSEGDLTLSNVSVHGCLSGPSNNATYVNSGGGIYVRGDLTMWGSTLKENQCASRQNQKSFGGGAFVGGSANIHESTIDGNYSGGFFSDGNVAGISIAGTAPSVIVNSTISGNIALGVIGGVYAYAQLSLSNSTVAFNQGAGNQQVAGGVYSYYGPLALNSTIIANNTAAGNEFDLYGFTVTGANNLIMGSNDSPPGTLTNDPDLQPLADNGGPTKTHALLATSVAVDAGNNVAGLSTDQRGAGFSRLSGAQVDIGAFEFQVAPPMTHTIGGNVGGLAGSGLVLQQSGGDNLPITTSGSFTFTTPVNDGAQYNVTVLVQPTSPNQTCVVVNGEGVVAGSNVTDVAVTCTTTDYTVGGSVSGLVGSGLVLQQSGGDDLPITADGSFTFPTPLSDGSAFTVSVSAQPSNPPETCVVVNGDGTIAGADVTDVTVTCSTDITDRIFASGFEVN